MHEQEESNKHTEGLTEKQSAVLAKLLKGQYSPKAERTQIPVRQNHSPAPLSFTQQRLWVLDRLVPGNPFYNLPRAFLLKGEIDIPLFERAIDEIVRRHESLRTVFTMDSGSGEPMQVILPELTIKTGVIDLTGLPPGEQQRETLRLTEAEAAEPFDLETGPLLRATLIHRRRDEHVLMFTMHHIVSDGWSVGIFMRELETLYRAFAAGKPSPLPRPLLQYPDFAVWQRQWMRGDVLEKQLSHWKEILTGKLPVLELPADYPRPAVPTYRGGMLDFELDAAAGAELIRLSRREKCSMFMVLMAAFNVLLYRYTGQEDILTGAPIANRNRSEVEEMIGFFANTLVFRTDLTGKPAFTGLLARVNKATTAAYDNQDLPFEKLVEEFQPDRYMSHTPFFQVMFNYESENRAAAEPGNEKGPGLHIEVYPVHNRTSKFDLWLTMTMQGDVPYGAVEYNTDIFAEHTVTRFINNFKTLLQGIAAGPNQPIHRLPVLTEAEKTELLIDWNDTDIEYDIRCLHHAFRDQAARTPGAPAVVFENTSLTYDELNRQANRLAHRLTAAGVTPGMPVGVYLERSFEMVTGLMGILKAGGAYLPLDPGYPRERLTFMIKDSALTVSVSTGSMAGKLPPFDGQVIRIDEESNEPGCEDDPLIDMTPAGRAYIIYTSGSTGKPKGVVIHHEGISNRLLWMQDAYRLTPADRVLQKTPFSFDVSVWEFFWPLLNGALLVVARPGGHKDSAYLIRLIYEQGITVMHFVPSMLNVFLDDPALQPEKVRTLRLVISSGEALPAEYRDRFFDRFAESTDLFNLYGPTEASVDVTYWGCERDGSRHIVPIGRPIANTRMYILDRDMNPVPTGAHGEIHIAGTNLSRGYLNNPELTDNKFIDAFGDQGGFFEKSPPWTPQKTFI